MPLPRQRDRIDHAASANRLALAKRQFGVEETEVEPGVVRDQRGIADEGEEFLCQLAEQRFVRKEGR